MDYKKEMRKLEEGRERYFPVIGQLLDMRNTEGSNPLAIDNPEMMRIVLELIDIGYLDDDAFIIDKKFNEIRRLYFKGGHVLTKSGWIAYTRHNLAKKKKYFKKILVLTLILLFCAAIFLVYHLV